MNATDNATDISDWLQLSLTAGRYSPEQLEQALLTAGALAVTLADGDDDSAPVLEPLPGQTPLWPRTRVTGLFDQASDPSLTRQRLQAALGALSLADCELTVSTLADRDWVRAWLDDYRPMRFGRRLWVRPHHLRLPDGAATDDAVELILDPGLAFGTGTHPTTALCLTWLDGYGAAIQGRQVIDYGCGSGILAIAAARLGAARVQAVDIDPQALQASRANAERNGVDKVVNLGLPDVLLPTARAGAGTADLLLANILAAPLIELAGRFADLLRPGGIAVLSGILDPQTDAVRQAAAPFFSVNAERRLNGWALLALTRR